MTKESLGLQWASQSYEGAVRDVDNRVGLAHPEVARHIMRDALRICRETLGLTWLIRESSEGRSGAFLLLDGPADASGAPADAVESVSRLFDLAKELHEARHVRG